jgi:exodeoxyribonuclease V alpha subunit
VLQLRNDYELKVYNGDLGTVRGVDPTEQVLDLLLDDGREVRYPYASAYALTHAYAATVHKVQGSEFPAVVIVLLTSHATMLNRTLVYTALTRARQLAVLVGQKRALGLAVRDWRRTARQTALAGLLTEDLHFSWPEPQRDATGAEDAAGRWEGIVEMSAEFPS